MADNLARTLAFPPTKGTRTGKLVLTNREKRFALCTWSTGTRLMSNGEAHTLLLEHDAADLTTFNTGRAPVLVEHERHINSLIGRVEGAWITPGTSGTAVIRFARHEVAERIYQMLLDEMPLSCSIGYRITVSEPAPDFDNSLPHYVCRGWRPHEISIVTSGADPGAFVCRPQNHADLVALLEEKAEERRERERAARLAGLHSSAWLHWATGTGAAALVAELGVDPERAPDVLGRLVAAQLGRLEAVVGDLQGLAEHEDV